MDTAKEEIAKNFDGQLSSYKEIRDIIENVAAYFLNPTFKWIPNCFDHPETIVGLYKIMNRFIKDAQTYATIDK